MPKLVDAKGPVYYPAPETWLCEPASSSSSDIQAELDKIPLSAPAGSLAEILLSSGLTVKMKTSEGNWVEI